MFSANLIKSTKLLICAPSDSWYKWYANRLFFTQSFISIGLIGELRNYIDYMIVDDSLIDFQLNVSLLSNNFTNLSNNNSDLSSLSMIHKNISNTSPNEAHHEFVSWNEANKECERLNMHLPSIHSEDDMSSLFQSTLKNHPYYDGLGMYIGLNSNVCITFYWQAQVKKILGKGGGVRYRGEVC